MGGALPLDSNPGTGLPTHIYPGLSRIAGVSCPWKKDLVFFGQTGSKKSSKSRAPVCVQSPSCTSWVAGPQSSPPISILPLREPREADFCSLSGRTFQLLEMSNCAAFLRLLTPCHSFKYLWRLGQSLCWGLWEIKEE